MTGGWFMTLFCPHYPKGGAILEPSAPWFTMRSFQWHSACPWNSTICGLGIKRVAGLWTHLQRCGGMGFQLHSVVGGGGMVVGWWWDGMGFRTSGTCCCLFCNFAWHLFPKFFPKQTDDYTTGFVPDYVPSICKAWFIIHGIPPLSTEIIGLPWTTDQH